MAAPVASTRTLPPSLPVATRRTEGARVPEREQAGLPAADGDRGFRWWLPGLVVGLVCAVATAGVATWEAWPPRLAVGSLAWWAAVAATHVPLAVIGAFLFGGFVEHVGYFWRGRVPARPGRLPADLPKVCVQLPMFNEHAVAKRLIEAACGLRWPADRLTIQVLDDSTDADTRDLVDEVCQRMRVDRGVDCVVLHRSDRRGYKAGALEAGRRRTDAELLAIFDADFVPPADFLVRAVAHFYDEHGVADEDLALVQAQWGHLNHDESPLTRAQSLWVDDHHTVQMSWRSAQWRFVNFTGTAGIWRARAVEAAGGWRAASLVEDCELSFRHLFAGYRTTFVKDIVVPAELPSTVSAYKAQQKRWTQGWVQLQRLHLGTLLIRYPTHPLRRLHLAYHMCIAWQWPAWALWAITFPPAIATGVWLGALDTGLAAAVYVLPPLAWLALSTIVASLETRHTYHDDGAPGTLRRRLCRIVPYAVVNTGMLPHQFSAFAEGLFGPMHSEFERTPKTGATFAAGGAHRTTTAHPATTAHRRAAAPKRRWPYQLTEAVYVAHQLTWAGLFARHGLIVCAIGASYMAGCVIYIRTRHGEHQRDGRQAAMPRGLGSDVDDPGSKLENSHDRLTAASWRSAMVPADASRGVPVTRFPNRILIAVPAGVAALVVVVGFVLAGGGDDPRERDSVRLQSPVSGASGPSADDRSAVPVPPPITTTVVPAPPPAVPADDDGGGGSFGGGDDTDGVPGDDDDGGSSGAPAAPAAPPPSSAASPVPPPPADVDDDDVGDSGGGGDDGPDGDDDGGGDD